MTGKMETLHLETVIANHTRDMAGRITVVTGTTSGTGYVCARELAKQGATVLLLNRASTRAESSLAQLQEEVPGGRFDPIVCDLQDLDSVRAAIATIKSKYDRLDVLCNNAGVMALEDYATKDGYDVQMQTNCISHFLLTKDLFPLLKKSDDARIVNHSSGARLGPPLEEKYFTKQGGNLGGNGTEVENGSFGGPRWMRYHQTKLANANFTYGLAARLDAAGTTQVKSLLAHPGLARTNLQITTAQTGGMVVDSPFMDRAQSPEDGALGIIRACMDPEAKSGNFYGPSGWTGFPDLLPPEDLLLDANNIRINWEGCEAAVGEFAI
ncbi:MAG: NAD(P)-dependent dehydrogenase (short-subunit alcohol dehydrogenase family) [Kiritimatiellia bacterium]|jgi:NAD(P)-dependent dehydrogenase (short-subunit alcohol dehydrogenase family)